MHLFLYFLCLSDILEYSFTQGIGGKVLANRRNDFKRRREKIREK